MKLEEFVETISPESRRKAALEAWSSAVDRVADAWDKATLPRERDDLEETLTIGSSIRAGDVEKTRRLSELWEAAWRHVLCGEEVQPMTRRLSTLAEGAGRYRWVYADPPWRYADAGCQGAAASQYDTMAIGDLERLPVGDLAHEEGCHLWMWSTWPMLIDGAVHRLMPAWGFRWVGALTWNKGRPGVGRWLRGQAEVLCLGVRGKLKLLRRDIPNVIATPRGRHSEKPESFRDLVASASPGPGIELFARQASPLCDRWGNEAPVETVYQARIVDLPPPARTEEAPLLEAMAWAEGKLRRLLELSPSLDAYDRASIRAVAEALPDDNPRLRRAAP